MLNKEFFNRPTNITVKVICDSISEQGIRITTLECEYPRFIHSEMMTHRTLSKNSSSSRAIPVQKMFDQIKGNTATPLYWGVNKSGMQALEELDKADSYWANVQWVYFRNDAIENANTLITYGNVHKQTVNRLTEPFQMMKVVITATDWGNFFNLRLHPSAQPEILMLAYKMYKAMEESTQIKLKQGEYHLPYINIGWSTKGDIAYSDEDFNVLTLEEAIKISAASCASVSYRTEGMTLEKADKIFDMLINAEVVHSSPFEHIATPVPNSKEMCYATKYGMLKYPSHGFEGITHLDQNGNFCSGNLKSWIQYRHLLPSNTCWKFDFNERMKMFDN
ncbi:MAG: FAD-dependent thymidylate synthase [Erysipelotrichaceae bacterium]